MMILVLSRGNWSKYIIWSCFSAVKWWSLNKRSIPDFTVLLYSSLIIADVILKLLEHKWSVPWGQRDSAAGKAYLACGSICGIPYSPLSTTRSNYWSTKPGVSPEHRQSAPTPPKKGKNKREYAKFYVICSGNFCFFIIIKLWNE